MKQLIAIIPLFIVIVSSSFGSTLPYNHVVAFGDSLSDGGNYYSDSYDPRFPSKRFTNGNVWVEYLNEQLGFAPITPSTKRGTNFAYGHAQSGEGIYHGNKLNVGEQIALYSNTRHVRRIERALVTLWVGGNDMDLENGGLRYPSQIVKNVKNHIRTLVGLGATHFLVPNLPPIGNIPLWKHSFGPRLSKGATGLLSAGAAIYDAFYPDTLAEENYFRYLHGMFNQREGEAFLEGLLDVGTLSANAVAMEYNRQLTIVLDALELELGVTIHRLDVFTMLSQVVEHPRRYGFTNVEDKAMDADIGLSSVYVFYDDVHPTTVVHEMLANEAYCSLTGDKSGSLFKRNYDAEVTLEDIKTYAEDFFNAYGH